MSDIDSLTLDESTQVQTARAAYEALNEEQKGYVQNIAILTSAETKITDLQAEADKLAAAETEAQRVAVAQKSEVEIAQDQNTYTVCITETGDKYHRDGCQYLRKSKIPIAKTDAVNGGYSPCSKCNP